MNPALLAFLPGALVGTGLAVFLLTRASRTIRVDDALARLGDVNTVTLSPAGRQPGFERAGSWLHQHLPNLPGLSAPTKQLDLLEMPVAKFYGEKLQLAVFGFLAPLVLPFLFQLFTGHFFALPLLLSPVVALILWNSPDASVRARAKAAQREFTRFVTVYLELVAVALLGEVNADNALKSAASVSDSWVFKRIRREYQVAELSRVSKWDALARLGDEVDVPALVEMARMMRLAEARVGLRSQLRAACNKLRKQVAADDKDAAERVTSNMGWPVAVSLLPIILITMTPAVLQLLTTTT
ncbi:hypothetical protein [Curtobacterium sp. PhB136]|uniref:hypothetical protein n=1 Tax=Curtobacterium sp. PhB136 TaxID=2485181 RepID=UPI001044E78F|nr:hypothetical protein [Curtobacterium sp. PhB136]TCK58284.1 hypothetical protein EDF27_3896 [Curtobacterium sp. PhB136]